MTFDDGYANNLDIVEPILGEYNMPFTVFISTEHIEKGYLFPTSVNRIIINGSGIDTVKIPSQNIELPLNNEKKREFATKHISNLLKTLQLKEVRLITEDLINNVNHNKWRELINLYQSVKPMTWDQVIKLKSNFNVTIGSHCMWHICCHSNHLMDDVRDQIKKSKDIIEKKLGVECRYFAYPNGDFTDFSNEVVDKTYSMGFSIKGKKKISQDNEKSIIPRISVPEDYNSFKIIVNLYPNKNERVNKKNT